MELSLDAIKELRKLTSASVSDCRKALKEAEGDIKRAIELLRKRGLEMAEKKQDRIAKEGRIEAYVHLGNKIGVLVEVNSETDFVARNSEFCQFTKDVAMQIAACSPLYIRKDDVPAKAIDQEVNKEQYYKTNCLLEQPFIKDPGMTIKDYLGSIIAKIGENIVIRRFIRYKLGE